MRTRVGSVLPAVLFAIMIPWVAAAQQASPPSAEPTGTVASGSPGTSVVPGSSVDPLTMLPPEAMNPSTMTFAEFLELSAVPDSDPLTLLRLALEEQGLSLDTMTVTGAGVPTISGAALLFAIQDPGKDISVVAEPLAMFFAPYFGITQAYTSINEDSYQVPFLLVQGDGGNAAWAYSAGDTLWISGGPTGDMAIPPAVWDQE